MKQLKDIFTPQLIIAIIIIICLTALAAIANADESLQAELSLTDTKGNPRHALLQDTKVEGEVKGLISTITIEQKYTNNSGDWVNGKYSFPLPEGAAVDDMTFVVGERVIKGVIKEKITAKKIFEEAKKAGKKAALMQQHRPNMFSINVANIPPHETLITKIRYIDTVRYNAGNFSLQLPTTFTPRYIPGVTKVDVKQAESLTISGSNGWSQNTDIVPDAQDISPLQEHDSASISDRTFSIDLHIESGFNLASITSDSHAIDVQTSNTRSHVQLKNGVEKMTQDFTLTWAPVASEQPRAAAFQQMLDGDYYNMVMFLPPAQAVNYHIPRDVTFIIDSSGSMAGSSMPQAKDSLISALSYLTPQDKFNIIDFDSHASAMFQRSQFVSQNTLQEANSFINELIADGGTDMDKALRLALSHNNQSKEDGFLQQIIFITDGSVGNEQQLFNMIKQQLGKSRLFTVGIGSAPNSYFMTKSAEFGRGTYTYINNLNHVADKMDALFKKIQTPVVKDLFITWPEQTATTSIEVFPQAIPDLYLGEPMLLVSKSNEALSQLQISGEFANTAWQRDLSINNAPNAESIDSLWGRKKIAHIDEKVTEGSLNKDDAREQIIALAIKHHLMSK